MGVFVRFLESVFRQVGDAIGGKRVVPVAAALLMLPACGDAPADDPEMEAQIEIQMAAAQQIEERFGGAHDRGSFDAIHEAGRPLLGLHTACARRRQDGARVLLVDGRGAIVEGPTQGDWFDYAWRKAGC